MRTKTERSDKQLKKTLRCLNDEVVDQCINELTFLSQWAFDSLSKNEVVYDINDTFRSLNYSIEKRTALTKELLEIGFRP